MVRQGWLEGGPGCTDSRGQEPFVPISWDMALQLAADELERVRKQHGNTAIYGGSYGWASAGRFHHAQGQIHRFLNLLGGYVRSENSYSAGAAEVILPHVIAPKDDVARYGTRWRDVVEQADLVVAFGGMPLKNAQLDAGGTRPPRDPRAPRWRRHASAACRVRPVQPASRRSAGRAGGRLACRSARAPTPP